MKCLKCGKDIKSGIVVFEQGNSIGIVCHTCADKGNRK